MEVAANQSKAANFMNTTYQNPSTRFFLELQKKLFIKKYSHAENVFSIDLEAFSALCLIHTGLQLFQQVLL